MRSVTFIHISPPLREYTDSRNLRSSHSGLEAHAMSSVTFILISAPLREFPVSINLRSSRNGLEAPEMGSVTFIHLYSLLIASKRILSFYKPEEFS